MTSAPKSDRITAALGPAMKLAKSTTFRPEKILSLAIESLLNRRVNRCYSTSMEPRRALFQEGRRAFVLVFRCRAQSEIGGLKQEAFALARLDALIDRVEREFDGDRGVGRDLSQDGLSPGGEIGRCNDLVDEADAISLLRADHLPG